MSATARSRDMIFRAHPTHFHMCIFDTLYLATLENSHREIASTDLHMVCGFGYRNVRAIRAMSVHEETSRRCRMNSFETYFYPNY